MRNIGRVPLKLEGREPQPLREGPDMIGQTCRHRRSAFLPGLAGGPGAERPHRPAEVVTVKGEVGGRLVRLPVCWRSNTSSAACERCGGGRSGAVAPGTTR